MSIKKSLFIAVSVIFAVALSACSMGEPMLGDHDVEISMEDAIAGQDAVMMGAATGDIVLSESEASSLLTELLKQNQLNSVEISAITADVDDAGVNTLAIDLASPVGGIYSLGVSGSLVSEGGVLMVDLDQAWAGGMGVDPAVLDMVSAQINASLAGVPMGLPDGPLAVSSDQATMLSDMLMQMGLNSAEITEVKTHFDGGNIGIIGELAEPVAGVDSLGLSAALSLNETGASLAINEAFAGNMVADSGIVSMIADQINSQIGGFTIPGLSIDAESGELMISFGQ
jgi:hypothetical protein